MTLNVECKNKSLGKVGKGELAGLGKRRW